MPHFTLQLDPASGPVLTAYVGVSEQRAKAIQAASGTVPQPIQIRALVDTGASCTCIDYSVLEALSLNPTGAVDVFTPSSGSTPHQTDQYDVSIIIPAAKPTDSPYILRTVPAVGADLAVQGIEALIGRDILKDCVLTYNGTIGMFTLAF